jgi:hypothetical protein
MKKLLIMVSCLCNALSAVAQGDIDEQQKVFFRNERSLGIMLNSDGVGLSYREAKRVDFLNKRLLEIDLGTLKHPREYKISNFNGTGSFVYGKLNTAIYLRAGIGRQHEIYRKTDLGGVAVRFFYTAGPVLGFYKPIYYRIWFFPIPPQDPYPVDQKLDVTVHTIPYDIYGKSSFFKGIGETKVLPGIYAKAGFNFEYSREDKVIHAIEVGSQFNAFPRKIPIMASADNKAIFLSLFISYRFGVITDPLHPEENPVMNFFKNKKE